MSDSYDRYLGMHRQITRRDFLNGAAIAIGALINVKTPKGLRLE